MCKMLKNKKQLKYDTVKRCRKNHKQFEIEKLIRE